MVAVIVGTTGGSAGIDGELTNTSDADDSVLLGGTDFSLTVGRAPLLGAARAAMGVINMAKESRQAPNTLLLLGDWGMGLYMSAP
jgi:hypothetical protein